MTLRKRIANAAMLAAVTAVLALPAGAQTPPFFSQNFNGGSLGTNLTDSSGAFVFSSGSNKTVSNGSGTRNYVKTAAQNYNTVDFIYRVDFNNTSASGYDGILFMGLENGLPSASNGREPDTALGYHLDPADFYPGGTDPATGQTYGNSAFIVRQNTTQTGTTYQTDLQRSTFIGKLPQQGAYTAEVRKRGDVMRYSILNATTGALIVGQNGLYMSGVRSLSGAAPFLNSTNSGLFFGTTTSSITFDNFSVTGYSFVSDATLTGTNKWTYAGGWGVSSGATDGRSNGSSRWSQTNGDTATLTFTGTQVALYGVCWYDAGIAQVSIDGGAAVNVDFYIPDYTPDRLVYTSPKLASGSHTLTVKVTGTKRAAATNTWINIDGADVTP